MKSALRALPLVAIAALACSSKSTDGGSGSTPATPVPSGPTTFTMDETVPGSSEQFKCQYVAMPATDGYVVGGQHAYTPGSHHLLIYSTDLASIPAGQTDVQDCYEASSAVMSHIRGVVYGGSQPTGGYDLPAGVGIPYKAGAVYLFQTHYLNPNANPIDAHVQVHLATAQDGITQNASVLFFYDPYIDVPVGAHATASLRCPINHDITLLGWSSHFHARGVGYQAYLDPPGAAPTTTPFYTSNDWASPTIVMNQPMQIAAGSHVRYFCDYDNTQGTQEYFQGQSAATNEMCMFIGVYYPAMTNDDDQCAAGDMAGTGTVGCVDTLNCIAACPQGGDQSQYEGYDTCTQKCIVASCPATSAPLNTVGNCIQTKCATECNAATAATDGGASACDSCVLSQCGAEYSACASAPCQLAQ